MSKNTPHFEMKNACNLLEKAPHDLKLFEKSADSYDLFNLIADLTHLYDWIDKDEQFSLNVKLAAKRLTGKSKDDLEDKEGRLVRQLCNRAKHFGISQRNINTRHRSAGFSAAQPGMVQKVPASFIVTVGDEEVDALLLCQNVLKKWEAILE